MYHLLEIRKFQILSLSLTVEAMSVFYLTIAGYIVVGGAGVGVFLYGKEHGNSIFDRLYRIFCMHLPRVLKKAGKPLRRA